MNAAYCAHKDASTKAEDSREERSCKRGQTITGCAHRRRRRRLMRRPAQFLRDNDGYHAAQYGHQAQDRHGDQLGRRQVIHHFDFWKKFVFVMTK